MLIDASSSYFHFSAQLHDFSAYIRGKDAEAKKIAQHWSTAGFICEIHWYFLLNHKPTDSSGRFHALEMLSKKQCQQG